MKCLVDLFPEVSFDTSKFTYLARMFHFCSAHFFHSHFRRSLYPFNVGNHWNEPKNRRKFFTQLAQSKGFDPLSADPWYSLSFDDVATCKVPTKNLLYQEAFMLKLIEEGKEREIAKMRKRRKMEKGKWVQRALTWRKGKRKGRYIRIRTRVKIPTI